MSLCSANAQPVALRYDAALARVVEEDVLGQLLRRDGAMRQLGMDGGRVKLDWVDHLSALLANEALLHEIFDQACAIADAGMRHVLWAGMGGSIVAAQAVFARSRDPSDTRLGIDFHACDSTDPASLNAVVREIAAAKCLPFDETGPKICDNAILRDLFADVMMIAVAMSATSEEPIGHLQWFSAVLEHAGLDIRPHVLVITPPDTALWRYAMQMDLRTCPVHIGEAQGFTGRTSAPATRIFLLAGALSLVDDRASAPAFVQALRVAWQAHALARASHEPRQHQFVRLAAALCAASRNGICHLMLELPEAWWPMRIVVEQLMEQSLGKGGQGVVALSDQTLRASCSGGEPEGRLAVTVREADDGGCVGTMGQKRNDDGQSAARFILIMPAIGHAGAPARLQVLTQWLLGWQLTAAVYGYIHRIAISTEPAVERYKSMARALRQSAHPLRALEPGMRFGDRLNPRPEQLAMVLQGATAGWAATRASGYIDLTVNGDTTEAARLAIWHRWRNIANELLGVPAKFRRAPAEYHVSEQSEMDGPAAIISLRVINDVQQSIAVGSYDSRFFEAKAIASWQAMNETGRRCYLLVTSDREEITSRHALRVFLEALHVALSQLTGASI